MTKSLDVQPISPIVESSSTHAQQDTETEIAPYFVDLKQLPQDQLEHLRQTGLLEQDGMEIQLLRDQHLAYLSQIWKHSLKAPMASLDASRPWMLYWCLHGCDLLDGLDEVAGESERCRMVSTLESCWHSHSAPNHPVSRDECSLYWGGVQEGEQSLEAGGFGGGPGQMAHAATTYAAVLSLCILATNSATKSTHDDGSSSDSSRERALALLRNIRIPLYRWMLSLFQPLSGGFRMHHDGEVDVRASYTILCCAKLLGTATKLLCNKMAVEFIASCQTFEGGLGGEPWSEAHGGYAYCGVAALQLMNRLDVLDLPALTGWLARRQMTFEGGFSGRSNKLVDGCYSFWQGGAVAIVSALYDDSSASSFIGAMDQVLPNTTPPTLLFDAPMLERYILLCAQDIHGGLRDKPSKSRDFYHSCYNLSGLSIAQHCNDGESTFGHPLQTKVVRTHPCYNIRAERVSEMLKISW